MTPASRPSDTYATRAARYGGAVQRGERGGGTTAAAVVLGCALIGAVAGYATSYAGHQEPAQLPSAVPLAATSPSVPTNPPVPVVPDSDEYPPLGHRPDLRDPVRPPGLGAVAVRRAQRLGAVTRRAVASAGRFPRTRSTPTRCASSPSRCRSRPATWRSTGSRPYANLPTSRQVEQQSIDDHSVTFTYVVDQPRDLPTLVLDLEARLGDRRLRDHGVGPVPRRSRVSRRCSTMCWRRPARSADAGQLMPDR